MRAFDHILKKRKIIRYSCLIIGVIIISYTGYELSGVSDSPLDGQTEIIKINNNSKDFSLEVNKPIFEGYNNSNLPYKISANNVFKKDEIFQLEDVKGEYYFSNNKKIIFFSERGNFDDNSKNLHLNENVKIIYDSYQLNGFDVNINVKNKSINTRSKVQIFNEDSSIIADSLNLPENSQIFELKGNVIATINLKNL